MTSLSIEAGAEIPLSQALAAAARLFPRMLQKELPLDSSRSHPAK
ncbi:MAG: hypothetical protein N2322_03750 [Terrimicrobiaceae bacterium]|nr:hypothetical protein [Terrimicrobiaceae bacterium]